MSHRKEHIDSLVAQCLDQKQSAQLEIYNRYYKAMFNSCFRILKSRSDAEDVMQEGFLKAFTKLDTFRGEVTFGAWLKRIIINGSIERQRQIARRNEISLEETMYKVEENEVFVLDQSPTQQKAQKVLKAMGHLKDSYRVSLTLHLIEGYDYQEISQILQISNANCRTMISRAKERLRKKLMITDG